jgi:hypothetical protein
LFGGVAEPEGAIVKVWRAEAPRRTSGYPDGLFRNADEVVVEFVVLVEVLINACSVDPGWQIGFDTQPLRAIGNRQKAAAERLVAVIRESGG